MLPYTDFVSAGVPLNALTFSVGNLPKVRDVYAQYKLTCDVSKMFNEHYLKTF